MRRRFVILAGLTTLWMWAGIATWASLDFYAANLRNRDFTAFYRSAETWIANGDLYDVEGIPNVNINPPHVSVILFVPMLLWPLPAASVVWFVIQGLAGAAALVMIRREVKVPAGRYWWIVGAFLASCAAQHHWREGQVTGALLLLATVAWRAARQQRAAAAPWSAAAITLKPWLVCWLPAMPVRRALWTMALGVAGVLAGVAILGLPAWTEWSASVQTKPVRPMVVNLSILAAIGRARGTILYNDQDGWPYGEPLWVVLALTVVALTWQARSRSVDRAWLAWGLAGILASPLGWAYYLVALTGPLVAWGEEHRWPGPAIAGCAFLLATREFMQELTLFPNGWFGGSIAFFGVLTLWAMALYWRTPASAPRTQDSASPVRMR